MTQEQESLPQLDIKSPIFTPRPGWGGKLKKWFQNNWRPYILPAIATALITAALYKTFIG